VYFAGAELGHAVSLMPDVSAFATCWPPAGLLLAVLVLSRPRDWPTLLLAACAASLASDILMHGQSFTLSLGCFVARGAEACLGAALIRRVVGLPITMARMPEVLALAGLAALISASCSALLGAVVATTAFSNVHFGAAWKTWFLADAAGVLVFAPVAFTWVAGWSESFRPASMWRVAEGAALFLGLALMAEGVYGERLPAAMTMPSFVLPFLLWAAFRFGPLGSTNAMMIVAVIGLWNASHGRGPFVGMSPDLSERQLRLQATLCVFSVSMLMLAATVAERRHAERLRIKLIGNLEQALREIKTLRGMIPICAWCKKVRNDEGFWDQIEDYLQAHTKAEFTHGMCPQCLASQMAKVDPDELQDADG
jgi:integral membrane sensor domain MASE1